MKVIEEHVEKMKGMTCAEKTRYVLEFVLHENKPFTKSKHWNRIYHFFYRNMHYQRSLETNRRSENKRSILLTGKPHKPTPRLRVPPQFDSYLEYRAYVEDGRRHLNANCISIAEAAQNLLTVRTN